VVEHLLNAIRLNSYEARKRFPRLLQIVELYTEKTLDEFINQSNNIPCWMFLGWLSQMTALLDKPEAKAIYNIIDKICTEYPQAFIYPFKISSEGFKFDFSKREQKEFVEKLKAKLGKMQIENQFVEALNQLNNPNLVFRDYITDINSNLKNRDVFLKICKEFYFNLVDVDSNENNSIEFGKIRKDFANFLKPLFVEEFGENGKFLNNLSEDELRGKFSILNSKVNDYVKQMKEGNLADYSPWLKNFKRNLAKDLEIPGKKLFNAI
jgi:DNA-dependent protein kinase catalytic subunit